MCKSAYLWAFPVIIDNIISLSIYIKHADKHVLLSLLIHCSIYESTFCGNHTQLYDIIQSFIYVCGIRKIKTIVPHPVLTNTFLYLLYALSLLILMRIWSFAFCCVESVSVLFACVPIKGTLDLYELMGKCILFRIWALGCCYNIRK